MSRHVSMSYAAVAGTAAGLGRSGGRTLVAGGGGLGFTGGELLAAALGGCFWNDLHEVAKANAVNLTVETVDAEIELAGNPPRVVRAHVRARLSGADPATLTAIFETAREASTIAGSLAPAFPIQYELTDRGST